jgi:Xaa-Pro aminopeptidase
VPRATRLLVPGLLLLLDAAGAEPSAVPGGDGALGRRERLADWLGQGYALVIGQPMTDVLQPPQEGHFLYLTGVDESGALLLLAGRDAAPLRVGGAEVRSALFLRGHDERSARFYGVRLLPGYAAARAAGVDAAPPSPPDAAALAALLAEALPGDARLHVPLYAGADQGLVREVRAAAAAALTRLRPDVGILDLQPQLARMRAVKDPGEVAALEEAVRVTLESLRAALPEIRPGGAEARVDGSLVRAIRERGARPAYRFVVAAGRNSRIPHYFRNDGPLRDGDLLVIDAGAEVSRYAADVTRTFPVSGRFTPRQREVYAAVLRAQRAAIRAVRPGATLLTVHAAAHAVLEEAGLAEHCLHATSHHVGLEVHDPGSPQLAPGMTITVEPGVYLEAEGFGVRIEDVVLVTEEGARVLSAAFPTEAAEVEALLRG